MKKHFGRHKASYQDLRTKDATHKARILPCDNRLRDIANADFEKGRLRIECWPSTNKSGRKWGLFQQERALVLHLKLRAQHDKSLRLDEFELSLTFHLSEEAMQPAFEEVEEDLEQQITDGGDIALIDIPSPDHVQGSGRQSRDSDQQGSWTFQGSSTGSPSPGGKWLWEADTYDTPMLHAGIALLHPNQPFFGHCRVRGRASRLRRRFKFDNANKEPIYLRLVPEDSNESLEQLVAQLNEVIKARISGISVEHSGKPYSAQAFADLGLERSGLSAPQTSYGSSSIGGSANVHLGNTYYVHHDMAQPSRSVPDQ